MEDLVIAGHQFTNFSLCDSYILLAGPRDGFESTVDVFYISSKPILLNRFAHFIDSLSFAHIFPHTVHFLILGLDLGT